MAAVHYCDTNHDRQRNERAPASTHHQHA
jgi:hypothetical protein